AVGTNLGLRFFQPAEKGTGRLEVEDPLARHVHVNRRTVRIQLAAELVGRPRVDAHGQPAGLVQRDLSHQPGRVAVSVSLRGLRVDDFSVSYQLQALKIVQADRARHDTDRLGFV